jgi:signal transduction histidine kinase
MRVLLGVLFVLLSSVIIASVASHRLARPVQRFARAAEKFGSGQRAEPLKLVGPLEIREAAAAFNAMQERIQRLVDSRTEMLTAISHDLRAPLTRMRLRGEFVDDPEQQRKLFRDVDEMQAMVEASLAFFRLDGQEEEATRFELGELIQTVLDDFHDLGQPVQVAGLQQLVYLGRPLALRRALTNLIDNAVKYGTTAAVTLSADDRQVLITIDDDGPGVSPALIPKLFQPFFRAEPSRNRATGGFGLGLASAQSIIRSHGGELRLSNRQPLGLRAAIVLPATH